MRVAILGATGAVGRTMLRILDERGFAVDELLPLASERSAGRTIDWRGRSWQVQEPRPGVFEGCDIALFSAGASRSLEWAPRAVEEGAVVIDNSSGWRTDPDVPLVVPEVNGSRATDRPKGIIANPNCATIQMVVVLEAVRRAAGLRRVVATTFQSVSGAGQKGIDALEAELAGGRSESTPFVGPIAGNVLPYIGQRGDDGWNEEEEKIRFESRKILELPELQVIATCVRVPVRVGHSISVTAELERPVSRKDLADVIARMDGVDYCPDRDPAPLEVAGTDRVCVGHLRVDPDLPNVVHFWVVADNLRKGAATNAVQIAELLTRA